MRKGENRAQREERKRLAAERTAWNRYSIHNRMEVYRRLEIMDDQIRAREVKQGLPIHGFDLQRAQFQNDRKYFRFIGGARYLPHQGARERARRLAA